MPTRKAKQSIPTANFVEVKPTDLISVNSKNKNKDNAEFYQPRHDKPDLNEGWVNNLKENGVLHPPIFMVKGGRKFIAAGTRRSLGASLAGLKTITAMEVPYDLARLKRIQSAENEQRKGNTVQDTLYNVMSFLQLDKQGRPQGLTFAETGKQFGKSHQWARDMAMMHTNAPKWLLDAVENNEYHLTAAFKLLTANVKANGGDKELRAAYDKAKGAMTTSSTGKPRMPGGIHDNPTGGNADKPKRLSTKLIEKWATNVNCPEPIRIVLQCELGIISIADAKKLANGKFDKWMVESAKATRTKTEETGKGKKKAKAKEEDEIEEDDLLEDEEEIETDLEEEEEDEDYLDEEEEEEEEWDEEDEEEEDEDEADDEEDEEDEEDEDEEEEEDERPAVKRQRQRAPARATARSRR